MIGFPRERVFIDPGYLCFNPLPLQPDTHQRFVRPHNLLHLEIKDSTHLNISTERKGEKTWRYTLNTKPVDRSQFEKAWRESFGWKSVMNSRVLTRIREQDMILYLNGRLESITRDKRSQLTVPTDRNQSTYLSQLFGLDKTLIQKFKLELHE